MASKSDLIEKAIKDKDVDILRSLREQDLEAFSSLTHQGETFLHLAVKGDSSQAVIQELLASRLSLAQRDADGLTPLERSLLNGNMTAVEAICDYLRGMKDDAQEKLLREGWNLWPKDAAWQWKPATPSTTPKAASIQDLQVSNAINHHSVATIPLR